MLRPRTGADHHAAAADHYESAAACQRRASSFYLDRDFVAAAREGVRAHIHMSEAVHHSNEATKYDLEHQIALATERASIAAEE